MKNKSSVSAIGIVLVTMTLLSPGLAQPAPVGTLTCTSMPSKARAAADAMLRCSFENSSGTRFQYAGTLLRKGKAATPPGKRVFVWSVLAPREVASGSELTGRYVGNTGAETAGVLSQRPNASIILKAPPQTSQLGENSAISVLELNLNPTRA